MTIEVNQEKSLIIEILLKSLKKLFNFLWSSLFVIVIGIFYLVLFLVLLSITLGVFLAVLAFPLNLIGLVVGSIFGLPEGHELVYGIISTIVLIILLVYFHVYAKAGTIELSNRSLAHRRNLLMSFLVTILIEKFNFDILHYFRAEGSVDLPSAKGLLASLALFFIIEYTFSFIFDVIKSVDSAENSIIEGSFFTRLMTRNIWIFINGNFRFIFDIVIPFLLFYIIYLKYNQEAYIFIDYIINFILSTLKDTGLISTLGNIIKNITETLADIVRELDYLARDYNFFK